MALSYAMRSHSIEGIIQLTNHLLQNLYELLGMHNLHVNGACCGF